MLVIIRNVESVHMTAPIEIQQLENITASIVRFMLYYGFSRIFKTTTKLAPKIEPLTMDLEFFFTKI